MQELTEQLEKAVREEKYEDAAQIRDQIRELEAKRKKSADTTTRSAE
jgi:protein-arginine kinase activator protein McsA